MNNDYLDSEAARKKRKKERKKTSYSLSREQLPFLAGRGKNRGSSLIWLGSA